MPSCLGALVNGIFELLKTIATALFELMDRMINENFMPALQLKSCDLPYAFNQQTACMLGGGN